MANKVPMKALLETGVHFGHQARKWNPKMAPYIFTKRNGIHIIDLRQTIEMIDDAYDLVRDTVARGGSILYVGTKRQAQDTITKEADRAGMPYVNQRWLGGTLTNWKTIRQSLDTLKRLEKERAEGVHEKLTKKERLIIERKIGRLEIRMGGLRNMKRTPELVFIIDVRREYTAIQESNVLGIPIIGVVDTNADPDEVDYLIPGNDDAIRAIKLLTETITAAVLEGKAMRKAYSDDVDSTDVSFDEYLATADEGADDEAYLGEATLAKLRTGGLDFDGEDNEEKAEVVEDTKDADVVVEEDTEEDAD